MADDGDGGLRINELATLVGLSASRASRLADGLVARGEASRQQCSSDRRSQRVTITQKGLDRLHAARPYYLDSVRRRIFDHISPDNYELLTEALRTIIDDTPGQGRATENLGNIRQISA
jgi:DNA-binding MarR family transcriptional regulator